MTTKNTKGRGIALCASWSFVFFVVQGDES